MGTNFYFSTKCKNLAKQFADYILCDDPDFHYEIHLAKTSGGWLPLFQYHEGIIESVKDIEKFYTNNQPEIQIVDEYDEKYTWEEFRDRVVEFNGGKPGGVKRTRIPKLSPGEFGYDPNLPDYTPISHFEYKGYSLDSLVRDPEGYEFSRGSFE